MTIKECIDIVDNIKPNQYTVSDKVRWLSFHDMGIINDVLKTHEGYDKRYDLFDGYTEDKLSVALIVPSPYDRLYPEYLKMKIDGENGETAKYNNSAALYNSYLMDYRKYYNKTHMPLDATRRGYRYEAPKKHTVGLTAAEYENLKRDLYYALSADVNEVVSPDKLYDIVTSYAYNNIEMLKGKDGKTPQKGIDYWTQEDVEEITDKASDIVKENVYTKAETDKFLGNKADISHTKNKDNPHEVTAEQVGAYPKFEGNELKQKVDDIEATAKKHHSNRDNPHGVTAHLVGAYTTSETDEAIKEALEGLGSIDSEALDAKADKAEVFEDTSFGWTEFEHSFEGEGESDIGFTDSEISDDYGTFTIHCAGQTLGFDFEASAMGGQPHYIIVNGVKYEGKSGSIPLTYMESDIIVHCDFTTYTFSNMIKRSIKGMGNISSALAGIIALENHYIDGGAV